MPEPSGPFAPNRDDVVAKIIDGELIIIRLSDGTYYSMDNVGACAWSLIESHHDLATMVATIAAWYAAPLPTVESDLATLVRELLDEGLIVDVSPDARSGDATAATPTAPGAYETPRLNIYRDMGNLLALDPPTPGIDDMPLKGGKYR